MTLSIIQSEIKAPKGQMNKFGNYKYRSCEDIVEAAKPILAKHGFALILTDEIVNIGNRFYVKATASIVRSINDTDEEYFEATAYAREEETKKGMDGAQITGAASSYARKYALNGLFAIDDTKDADATNNHDNEPLDFITDKQKDELLQLLETSTYDEQQRTQLRGRIAIYDKSEQYEKAKTTLLDNQQGFNGFVNPGQKDINKHLRKTVKA
jgi:hypothetical protein